jgi:hypothetical protein
MMLSAHKGAPDGHQQVKLQICNDGSEIIAHRKAARKEVSTREIENDDLIQAHLFESCGIKNICAVYQTGNGARIVASIQGRDDCDDQQSDRMATTLRAWILCWRSQEEVKAQPCLEKNCGPANLSGR